MTSLNIQGELRPQISKLVHAVKRGDSIGPTRTVDALLALFTSELEEAKADALNDLWQNSTERFVAYDDEISLRQGWLYDVIQKEITRLQALSAGDGRYL